MAARVQTVAGSPLHALLSGYPVNCQRVVDQTTNRKGRTVIRSSLTDTSVGSLGLIRGSAGQRHKLSLRCLSGCAGEPSILSHPSASFFCNISSGRSCKDRIVCYTSEGETVQQSYRWPDNQKPRICILGGGFGGLYTALRLESLVWTDDKKPQILLVDQSDRFVFKPLLYELLSGEVDPWEIAPTFKELLKSTSIQFIKDKVKLLQPSDHLDKSRKNGLGRSCSGGTVLLESGLLVEYDWLVLALGAAAKLDVVPGSAEFAYPFSTLDDAIKVDDKLRILEREHFSKDSSTISVAIVGCGYSGVELAATISERLKNLGIVQAINIETSICPTAPSGNREAALKVAFQQADFAGWNLWAAINERPLLPFHFQNLGEMMTLGRNDAAISPSFIEGLTLDGSIGHTARKLAYLWRLPTDEHRLKVGISWLTKSAIDTVASLQTTIVNVLSGS